MIDVSPDVAAPTLRPATTSTLPSLSSSSTLPSPTSSLPSSTSTLPSTTSTLHSRRCDRVACSGDPFPFVRPEGASPPRIGGCGTDDGASTDGSDPCTRCAPFRCLCVVRWTPSSSASSGAPLCGLWARPAEQEDVGASGSPAVGRQRDGSGISPPSCRPCPAGSTLARRFGEFPAAVQAPGSLAPLGPAALTPPGALLGVEEGGSPLAGVGCPIPGSLGSYEVAEPVPPSPDHLGPGLSAWLGSLESQPGRAPQDLVPDSREAHPVSVGAQPCAHASPCAPSGTSSRTSASRRLPWSPSRMRPATLCRCPGASRSLAGASERSASMRPLPRSSRSGSACGRARGCASARLRHSRPRPGMAGA